MVRLGRYFFPIYIPIAKYYFKRKAVIPKRQFEREIRKHDFIYKAIFDGFRYNFVITKDKSAVSGRYPIWVGEKNFTIAPYQSIYVTASLYHKLKSKLRFTGMVVLNDSELQDIRTKLANTKFDKSVFYIFQHGDANAKWEFSIDDFTIPNTNVNIKSTGERKQDIFNYFSEKKANMTEKVKAPQDLIKRMQSEELNLVQSLSKKVNIKSLTHAYEKFFLYD